MYRTKDQVAQEFIAEGRRRGIAPRGIVICIATGLVESNLTVYANAKVPGSLALPHDAVGSDGMSVGPLQQQVIMGNGWWWGPVEVCQDPTGSAGLFYARLANLPYQNTTDSAAGAIAQQIQKSAYPDRYAQRMAEAQAIYNRLSNTAPARPTVGVPRANVDFAKHIWADRVGNDYVYGGNWRPDNIRVGTDCSGAVIDICDAVRNGTAMAWTRHGMSTESWRPIEVGQTGTIFNTVCVAHPNDFPADAAVKIAIHHGPGGGANSHMWCEVDGIRVESNGSDGAVTGSRARSVYDTNYANDWHYLPGPVSSIAPTDPIEEFLMLEVHSWSIYAKPGEPKIPVYKLIQALDAHGPHEPYWEQRARDGDPAAIQDLARVAVNGPWNFDLNRYVDDPIAKRRALGVLLEIQAAHPEWITAATPVKAP